MNTEHREIANTTRDASRFIGATRSNGMKATVLLDNNTLVDEKDMRTEAGNLKELFPPNKKGHHNNSSTLPSERIGRAARI
ncbi:hypothetical protein GF389_00320 [Candidatus Dojkabacteria bacterium]|nr:hypothetical protein [Candidatus Dojkabacteria bacterium]